MFSKQSGNRFSIRQNGTTATLEPTSPGALLAQFVPETVDLVISDLRPLEPSGPGDEALYDWLEHLPRVLRSNARALLVCTPGLPQTLLMSLAAARGQMSGTWLVWDEPLDGTNYRSALVLHLVLGDGNPSWPAGVLPGAMYRGCVTYAQLASRLIALTTRPGDVVVDPCAGDGATVRAATSIGRNAVAATMDLAYFERFRSTRCP